MRHRRAPCSAAALTTAVAVFAIVLAACGSTTSASPPPTAAAASAAASPAATSSAPASATTGGPATLCATDQQPCPIEAGTYTTRPFEPAFTFTVGDGWTNDRLFADGGQISKGQAGIVWASGVRSGQVDGTQASIAPGAVGFLAHLAAYKGFTVSPPTPVTVGGLAGQQVDVVTNDVQAPGIYFIEQDRMNLGPGEKARFIFVEKDSTLVILIIEAYEAAQFDTFLTDAQPVVDSIAWED
jgi:hypothetical protein